MTLGALFRGSLHQATTTQGHLSGQSYAQVQSHSSSSRLFGHLSSARPPRRIHTPSVLQRNARTNIACRAENPRSARMADPSLDLVQTLFEQTTKRYVKLTNPLTKPSRLHYIIRFKTRQTYLLSCRLLKANDN
jgi:hypothetical protein